MNELLEARIAAELAEQALDAWAAARPAAAPPVLTDPATRAALPRGSYLGRLALAASFVALDPGRTVLPVHRTEARFLEVAAIRHALARRLGFADPWALYRAAAGEPDSAPDPGSVPGPVVPAPLDHEAFAAVLADPAPLIEALSTTHGLDARPIRVDVDTADAPEPGRTYIVHPGRDVRVRVHRRPGSTARGTVRVLLHELGHALVAAAACAPPSRAADEGVAAWFASLLEREKFLVEVIAAPAEFAAIERAARAARRARLTAAAAAEHAFYRADGPPPFRDALAWTDPGGSASYARAELERDRLDAELGAGWPTGPLGPRVRCA